MIKNKIGFILLLPLTLVALSSCIGSHSARIGSTEDFIEVLKDVNQNNDEYHKYYSITLTKNIDFKGQVIDYDEIFSKREVLNNVYFKGKNKTISNLTLKSNRTNSLVSLFYRLHSGVMMDVTFKNIKVIGGERAAVICQTVSDTFYFDNVHIIDSEVSTDPRNPEGIAGGFCGYYAGRVDNYASEYTEKLHFKNCSIENSKITGGEIAGGIAGMADQTRFTLTDLKNVNTNVSTLNKSEHKSTAGGIFGKYTIYPFTSSGFTTSLSMSGCENSGTIDGDIAGGIIGQIDSKELEFNNAWDAFTTDQYWRYSSIENCKNSGTVTGYMYSGGVIGSCNFSGERLVLNNCINEGNISTTNKDEIINYVGGIIGANSHNGSFTNCKHSQNGVVNGVHGGGIAGAAPHTSFTGCVCEGTCINCFGIANSFDSLQSCNVTGTIDMTTDGDSIAVFGGQGTNNSKSTNNSFSGTVNSSNGDVSMFVGTENLSGKTTFSENVNYCDGKVKGAKRINIIANKLIFSNSSKSGAELIYKPIEFGKVWIMNEAKVYFSGMLQYNSESKTKTIDITYPNTIVFVNSENKGVLPEKSINTGDQTVIYSLHS